MKKKKLAFIGAGKMAEALLKGVLNAELFAAADIIASDVNLDRLNQIKNIYHIDVSADNTDAVDTAETVILAVKPQHINDVVEGLSGLDLSGKLLISIAAGVTTKHILSVLKRNAKIVRVMPNAPALVGKGISALTFPGDLPDEDRRLAEALFQSVGEVVILDESLINQATAISGSGPAYFFYFVQALIAAGEKIGFSREIAAELVVATIKGSAEMLASTKLEPADLIAMVASKGGTTEAALNTFDHGKINDIIIQGVLSAVVRAQELNSAR